MKQVKAKFWIIIGNFFFNTYYTWMILIFSMEAFTLSPRKFEIDLQNRGLLEQIVFLTILQKYLLKILAINLLF